MNDQYWTHQSTGILGTAEAGKSHLEPVESLYRARSAGMAPEAVPEIRLKPLDKLQMIYRGIQRERVAERQRCNQKSDYGNNALYIRGTSRDQMLSVVLEELKAVKEDHFCKR